MHLNRIFFAVACLAGLGICSWSWPSTTNEPLSSTVSPGYETDSHAQDEGNRLNGRGPESPEYMKEQQPIMPEGALSTFWSFFHVESDGAARQPGCQDRMSNTCREQVKPPAVTTILEEKVSPNDAVHEDEKASHGHVCQTEQRQTELLETINANVKLIARPSTRYTVFHDYVWPLLANLIGGLLIALALASFARARVRFYRYLNVFAGMEERLRNISRDIRLTRHALGAGGAGGAGGDAAAAAAAAAGDTENDNEDDDTDDPAEPALGGQRGMPGNGTEVQSITRSPRQH